MELRPGRQRLSAAPIIAKGLIYPLQNQRASKLAHTALHLNRTHITEANPWTDSNRRNVRAFIERPRATNGRPYSS